MSLLDGAAWEKEFGTGKPVANKPAEYKSITIDGEEFLLVPKPKEDSLDQKYKIRFEKSYVEKHFDVQVFGWSKLYDRDKSESFDTWVTFRRIEQENGNFKWWNYSTGGIHANMDMAILLEKWYSEYMHKNS